MQNPPPPIHPVPDHQDFSAFDLSHPFNRYVSPLIAVREKGGEQLHGTACLIGPGYAMTATHVVHDYMTRLQGSQVERQSQPGTWHTEKFEFWMHMIVTLPDNRRVQLQVNSSERSS